MKMAPVEFELYSWQAVLLCLLFAVVYVGSLYMWANSNSKTRDHPDTIKRRFISVAVICVNAIPFLWCFANVSSSSKMNTKNIASSVLKISEFTRAHSLLEWLGLRFSGLIPALVLPLLLTMVLFLGPLSLHYMDGVFRLYLEPKYWTNSFKNYVWLRNHVVAPLSEEFIFRACMLPLLVPHFGEGWSIFLCPLFFGVAHLHHMIEKVTQQKEEVSDAFKQSLFQMSYTTVFGAYSAFLFLRTGHFVAPALAHAFCNHMGLPAFNEVLAYDNKTTRRKLIAAFVLGLVAWLFLLYPLTTPFLYSNEIYDC